MEFTVYDVNETTGSPPSTTTNQYIKKEDAERVFNEILGVDLEKYMFYTIAYHNEQEDASGFIHYMNAYCQTIYSKGYDEDGLLNIIISISRLVTTAVGDYDPLMVLIVNDNIINYKSSILFYNAIRETIPNDSVNSSMTYRLTLYYRER